MLAATAMLEGHQPQFMFAKRCTESRVLAAIFVMSSLALGDDFGDVADLALQIFGDPADMSPGSLSLLDDSCLERGELPVDAVEPPIDAGQPLIHLPFSVSLTLILGGS